MGSGVDFLIVDDDVLVARAIARVLSAHGGVSIATSVKVAKERISDRQFDAFLIDIGLPDGSGFELIEWLRSAGSAADVVIFSGTVTRYFLSLAHELGATYLEKPVSAESIELFARRVIARQAAHHASDIDAALADWRHLYGLTASEVELLRLTCLGNPRARLCEIRDVAESTIKTQIAALLRKTQHRNLDEAAIALLRFVLSRPTRRAT